MLGRCSLVIIASYTVILRSVCACGEWVCTKNHCEEEEEDTEESDPEDDPDIQDIRWF